MGASCCKATDYFIDLTVLSPDDIERRKIAHDEAATKTYEYPWFEPYTLDYIEALTHVRVLGVGDYGFVQLMAHNSRKNESDNKPQQLAVKSVFKATTTAKQFTAEKDAMVALQDCPFVAKYRGCAQTEEMAYIAMDYYPGPTLQSLMDSRDNNKLDEDEAKFYMAQIVVIVKAVHAAGLILRDLKATDLCIARDGYLRLVDFSNCIKTTIDGRVYSAVPRRMTSAPELLHKDSTLNGYGVSVDWWAAGCLLFQMLMGRHPFGLSVDSPYSLYTAIRQTQKSPLKLPWMALTNEAKDLVRRLLDPALSRRLKQARGVQKHDFFFGLDWSAVKWRALAPPLLPIQVSNRDFRYFPRVMPPDSTELSRYKQLKFMREVQFAIRGEKTKTEAYLSLMRNKKVLNRIHNDKVARLLTPELRAEQATANADLWQQFSVTVHYVSVKRPAAAGGGGGGKGVGRSKQPGHGLRYDDVETVKDTSHFGDE